MGSIALWIAATSAGSPARAVPDAPREVPASDVVPVDGADGVTVADLARGSGAALAVDQLAIVEATIWGPDGVIRDSTWSRSGPDRMYVGGARVPAAWSSGLVGMRIGGARQVVWTPPAGADGDDPVDAGSTDAAPGDRRWIAEFELVDVRVPPAAPAPAADRLNAPVVADPIDGHGALVAPDRTVTLDYTLWLAADGAPVDSSYTWSEPLRFDWGSGVQWEQALTGMRAGGRREIRLPAAHGFGADGRPPAIPADADLVLIVDLWSVE